MIRAALFAGLLSTAMAMYGQEVAPPPPPWSGALGAGLSLTRGNSDTKNINLTAEATQRINPRNVVKYDAFYLRADSAGTLTVDRTAFGARDELSLSPLTYAFGDLHFLRDRFKEIDSLITPTAGVGHHFVKTATMDLALEAGAGAIIERDLGRSTETSGAVTAKQLLTWKLSPTATLGESAAGLWKTSDFGDSLYHFEASLATGVTTHTQLKLSALDDYKTRQPSPGVKKNDISIIAAFVMKF